MIDRELVDRIARFAIRAYCPDLPDYVTVGELDAVLATVDEFTSEEDDEDAIAAEAKRIYDSWLVLNAKPDMRWWLQQEWARERVAWRKEREANSR